MNFRLRVKTLNTHPMLMRPMKTMSLLGFNRRNINEDGRPPPTREQREHFKENREEVIERYLEPQLRKTKNIFHGGQSRNKLIIDEIGEEKARELGLLKRTYDYDVYSKHPEKHARQLENKIDNYYDADMTYVKQESIGRDVKTFINPGPINISKPREESKHKRFTVNAMHTPSGKSEVDYATLPDRNVKTLTKDGIRHETICSTLERHKTLVHQPRRAAKTWEDLRRLRKYKEYIRSNRE